MGARWYDAQIGRWISADTIIPGFTNPQNLNRYSYVTNNALRYVDPSGHQGVAWEKAFEAEHGRPPNEQDRWDYQFCSQVTDFAGWESTFAMRQLLYNAGITLKSKAERRWVMSDVQTIYAGVKAMSDALGGPGAFKKTVGETVFRRVGRVHYSRGSGPRSGSPSIWPAAHANGKISVYDGVIKDHTTNRWVSSGSTMFFDPSTVVHELAHRWGRHHGRSLERQFEKATGGSTFLWMYHPKDAPTDNALQNRMEDFADSVQLYLFPNPAHHLNSLRTNYVGSLFNSPP